MRTFRGGRAGAVGKFRPSAARRQLRPRRTPLPRGHLETADGIDGKHRLTGAAYFLGKVLGVERNEESVDVGEFRSVRTDDRLEHLATYWGFPVSFRLKSERRIVFVRLLFLLVRTLRFDLSVGDDEFGCLMPRPSNKHLKRRKCRFVGRRRTSWTASRIRKSSRSLSNHRAWSVHLRPTRNKHRTEFREIFVGLDEDRIEQYRSVRH